MDTTIFIISFLIISLLFNIIIIFYIYKSNRELKDKIQKSIEPKFLEIAISPESNKIIWLAIDVWRLEERFLNINNINDLDKEKVINSIKRVKRLSEENMIEVKWYTWEKYSDEVNVYELKWSEITENKDMIDTIKDTIEPAVFIDWNIVKTAKIIVYKLNS